MILNEAQARLAGFTEAEIAEAKASKTGELRKHGYRHQFYLSKPLRSFSLPWPFNRKKKLNRAGRRAEMRKRV